MTRKQLLLLPSLLLASGTQAFVASNNKPNQWAQPLPTTKTFDRAIGLSLSPVEAWNAYNDALEASPLLVKSVTACAILGAADLAGQAIQSKQKGETSEESSINWARTVRFAFFGLVLQAPWNHFYYLMLDGALPPTVEPWTPTTGIKVAIDQFVQAPIFTVLIFSFLGALEGKNLESIKKQLDEDYADTVGHVKNA